METVMDVTEDGDVFELDYPCPNCGNRGTLTGERVGRECHIVCEHCAETENEDEYYSTMGIHDVLETVVAQDPDELDLHDVPASKITT